MLVKDHIRRTIFTVDKSATFREALQVMIEKKTNGLLVVDENGKDVGIIDSFTLINEITPSYLHDDPTLTRLAPESVFYKAVSASLNKPVGEMMQPLNGICVHEDDNVMLAATLASKHGVRYIPVHDEGENLVGLVSRTDIKRAMAKLLHIEQER